MISALCLAWAMAAQLSASPSTTAVEAPSPAASPPTMLVLDVTGGELAAPTRTALAESLGLLLARRLDVEVFTAASLRDRVGLAVDQQLAGCDAAACMAEVADALGARYVVFSRIVALGGDRVLRVEVFDKSAGRAVALATGKGGDGNSLAPRLPGVVDDLVVAGAGALPVRAKALAVAVPTGKPSPWVSTGLAVGGVGLGGLIAGGLVFVLANDHIAGVNDAADAYRRSPDNATAKGVIAARGDLPEPSSFLWAALVAVQGSSGRRRRWWAAAWRYSAP
ncbi:MAG: hypothetical protein FJ137_13055 [Deltaproteobacteria bacterium]|nr:hypothetical protein [Deltaproteobacteria bacterium]